MTKRLTVSDATIDKDRFIVTLSETIHSDKLQASGRMLVDSDQLAFIYIVDSDDGYIYLQFKTELWPKLKAALVQGCPAFLVMDDRKPLELSNFHKEINYLIENISENPNYGEQTVAEVGRYFSEQNVND